MFTVAKRGEREAAALLPDGYREEAEALGGDYLIFDGDVLPSPLEVSKVRGGGYIAKAHSKLLSDMIAKGAKKPAAKKG